MINTQTVQIVGQKIETASETSGKEAGKTVNDRYQQIKNTGNADLPEDEKTGK